MPVALAAPEQPLVRDDVRDAALVRDVDRDGPPSERAVTVTAPLPWRSALSMSTSTIWSIELPAA